MRFRTRTLIGAVALFAIGATVPGFIADAAEASMAPVPNCEIYRSYGWWPNTKHYGGVEENEGDEGGCSCTCGGSDCHTNVEGGWAETCHGPCLIPDDNAPAETLPLEDWFAAGKVEDLDLVRRALHAHAGEAFVNVERQALQVLECGAIAAHIPLTSAQVEALTNN